MQVDGRTETVALPVEGIVERTLDLEMAVLAALCSDDYLLSKAVDEGFHAELLRSPIARLLATTLLTLREQGVRASDLLLLRARLEEQGLLCPQVNAYLEELARVPAPHLDQLMTYLELLRDRASRERLSALSTRIESYARQQQGGVPMADFLADAFQELLDIQKQRVRGRLTPVSELVQGLVSEAQHRPPGQKILLGYSVTPFERLNQVLSGLRPGFYYGLAGAPPERKDQLGASVGQQRR